MKKFKRCKKYEKFSMAKWTERRNAQYKRDSDMVWFMLKAVRLVQVAGLASVRSFIGHLTHPYTIYCVGVSYVL